MRTKRITKMALLTAIALTIFMLEAQVPLPVPLPGMKLGLANIVTVYAMFVFGPKDTLWIFLSRMFLGGIFSGRVTTLLYSLAGGLCCYFVMLLLHKLFTRKQIWICYIFGSIAHVIGQTLMAIFVTGTPEIGWYLPVLLISAMITGALTGFAAQMTVQRLPNGTNKP